MAKTLIIKGANYAANKLDTVSFESVPCTGISLSESTLSFASLTSSTLTATLTPADTTDTLMWASSDTDVATVVNGIVTAVGIGTATITATCGEQSATCAITVANVVADPVTWLLGSCIPDTNGTASFSSNTKQFTAIGHYIDGGGNLTTQILDDLESSPAYHKELHPIAIPIGASTITVDITTLPTASWVYVSFFDGATAGVQSYPQMLKGLSRVFNSISSYPASVNVTIPEGAIYATVASTDKIDHAYTDDMDDLTSGYGITIKFN